MTRMFPPFTRTRSKIVGSRRTIDQTARQQYRITSRLTQVPNAGTEIDDPIPTIDIHGQPQLRPKPLLIEFQRGHVIRLET